MDELEFGLELLKVLALVGLGVLLAVILKRIRDYTFLYRFLLTMGGLWFLVFVASVVDVLDDATIEEFQYTGILQVVLEDLLIIVSIFGVGYALYRYSPTLMALENTANIMRRHEADLISRERNEIRLNQELEALYQLQRTSTIGDLNEILKRVAFALDVSRVGFWLFNDSRDAIVCEELIDARQGDPVKGLELRQQDFPRYFGAIQSSRVLRAIDAEKDPRTSEFVGNYFEEHGIKSLCDVSLEVPGVLMGVICVEAVDDIRNWSFEEVSFIRSVGDLLIQEYAKARILESNAALTKTKAEFQAIADYTYGWEMWLDRGGRVLWVNAAARRITGYSVAECLGIENFPLNLAADDDERRRFREYIVAAGHGGVADSMPFTIVDRDGRRKNLEISWQSVKENEANVGGIRMSIRDVTARLHAEQSLRVEENKRREAFRQLQAFLQSTPTPFIQVDLDGKVVEWNPSAERVFGWQRDEALGRETHFLFPEHLHDRVAEWRQGEVKQDYVTRTIENVRKDGSVIICEWHNTIVRDDDGAPAVYFAIALDVTERVLSRRRLEAERQRLLDFSGSASDFFWEIDSEGAMTYASERLYEFIDSTPEEMMGRKFEGISHFYEGGGKGEVLQAIDTREPFRDLIVRGTRRITGGRYNFSLSATPIFDEDGQYLGYRGTGREVTGEIMQKTLERLISLNVGGTVGKDYFSAVAKNLVGSLDIDWAFIAELDRIRDGQVQVIAGCGPDGEVVPFRYQIEGTPCSTISRDALAIYKDGVAELFPDDADLKRLSARGYAGIRLDDANGSMIGVLILISSMPLREEDTIRSALHVFAPRAAAELNRRRSEEEREVLQMQFLHSQRMETMGALAGGIAHDFNNILTPIMGYSDMLVEDLADDNSARGAAEAILRGARRAKGLVEQILDFSRRGDATHAGTFDLVPIIESAISFISATLPPNIRIATTVDGGTHRVQGDPTKFDQVLMNLITNSWHAIGEQDGEIEIRIETASISEEVAAIKPPLRPGSVAKVSVIDNGCGINSETLDRIFEPYFTTKGSGKGTGFGLSTVKGIIESMGGVVEASSRFGEGATFSMLIPLSDVIQEEATDVPIQSPFALASRLKSAHLSVLYIDDEKENAVMASKLLERLGHSVTVFDMPEDALAAVRDDPSGFDMMITDDSMPGMSGSVLSAEVLKVSPYIPIIVVSGGSGQFAAERYGPLGVSVFVSKPFGREEIETAIRTAADVTVSNLMERL
ncbi:MAG: PAS domain S-box protein [Rhodospirillales bacterium]|nr:PAS domain S-box protein [Rhodospirillales bacterium]MBO6786156.1 PAS domain S-box protein [Rhodospirillales bacterium]